jgi:hypothetical protein
MKCKQCDEAYDKQFHEDFVKGICLPCQVQNRYDKWWDKIQKGLLTYNTTNNSEYDFNSFSYDCSIGVIKIAYLSEYPELKKICKEEWECWEEYRQQQLQPELPF